MQLGNVLYHHRHYLDNAQSGHCLGLDWAESRHYLCISYGRLQVLINICIVETTEYTGYLPISPKMMLQHEWFINFLQIKTYANPKKLLLYLPWIMYILNNHMIHYMLFYSIITKNYMAKRHRLNSISWW